MDAAHATAARITGTVWAALRTAGNPRPRHQGCRLFPGVLDPGWLACMPLPLDGNRPTRQPVALLQPGGDFDRLTDPAQLDRACRELPRTQVTEDIGYQAPGTWYALAAWYLTRLSGSTLHATCSIYQSRPGDLTAGLHADAWHNAVIQVAGAKHWAIEHNRPVTTRAGDILVIPKMVQHAVSTPESPGHSVHLAFALHRDLPSASQARLLYREHEQERQG